MIIPTFRRAFVTCFPRTMSSPFSRAVVTAMQKLYPEELADKSWDNTGLLLEAPFQPTRRQKNSVLLTIDLTKAVADEAIERKDSIIIAYHPIIFRGLKSLTLSNSQQHTLLRLAAAGISVYSPHTALDSAPGGINDWLADIVTGTPPAGGSQRASSDEERTEVKSESESSAEEPVESIEEDPFVEKRPPVWQLRHHPSQLSIPASDTNQPATPTTPHTRTPITPLSLPSHPTAGLGRLVRFQTAQPLPLLIERIAWGVGNPKGFPVAIPQGTTLTSHSIRSVGICAGSGSSVLAAAPPDTDLLFTGEMSHHEALAATERGQCVVTLFHSNTERGFLAQVLRWQLAAAVEVEWGKRREDWAEDGYVEVYGEGLGGVDVSEKDRDPFGIVVAKGE